MKRDNRFQYWVCNDGQLVTSGEKAAQGIRTRVVLAINLAFGMRASTARIGSMMQWENSKTWGGRVSANIKENIAENLPARR